MKTRLMLALAAPFLVAACNRNENPPSGAGGNGIGGDTASGGSGGASGDAGTSGGGAQGGSSSGGGAGDGGSGAGSGAGGTGGSVGGGGGTAGTGATGGSGGSAGAGAAGGSAGTGGTGTTCLGQRIVDSDEKFDALVAERCEFVLSLQISNLTRTSLAGLETIKSAGGVLIRNNNALTSLQGLDNLVEVTALLIEVNEALASIEALAQLEVIAGNVHVVSNGALPTLRGLDSVVEVAGYLAVRDNNALTTLGPLLSWPVDALQNSIQIFKNPVLPQCEVDQFDILQTSPNAECSMTSETLKCIDNNGVNNCRPPKKRP